MMATIASAQSTMFYANVLAQWWSLSVPICASCLSRATTSMRYTVSQCWSTRGVTQRSWSNSAECCGQAVPWWSLSIYPWMATATSRWIVRRSLPEIGFASVELTLPWLAPAVAGVNEKGLAVAIVPEAAERAALAFSPPALLLVQDCLQRFADLESALEWCARRPAAPGSPSPGT